MHACTECRVHFEVTGLSATYPFEFIYVFDFVVVAHFGINGGSKFGLSGRTEIGKGSMLAVGITKVGHQSFPKRSFGAPSPEISEPVGVVYPLCEATCTVCPLTAHGCTLRAKPSIAKSGTTSSIMSFQRDYLRSPLSGKPLLILPIWLQEPCHFALDHYRCLPIFRRKQLCGDMEPIGFGDDIDFGDDIMNSNFRASRGSLLTRWVALLATTIAGFSAAALAFSPAMPSRSALSTAAQAENLSEKVQQIPQRPVGFADIVEKVKPAVISVKVKIDRPAGPDFNGDDLPFPPGSPFERFFKRFGNPNTPKDHKVITGQGSGFIISPDGYAVTNNHVVHDAENVQVTTDDGKIHSAKVIGADPRTDLALIKVDGENFLFVKLADSLPRVGDWVLAVGNPFGLGGTVTAGIVSARGRDIGASSYDDFIQIDAPVNKGNSGGPTFDVDGNVIGVNTAIFSPSGGSVGIAFAIPADTVRSVVAQLRDKGTVTRG